MSLVADLQHTVVCNRDLDRIAAGCAFTSCAFRHHGRGEGSLVRIGERRTGAVAGTASRISKCPMVGNSIETCLVNIGGETHRIANGNSISRIRAIGQGLDFFDLCLLGLIGWTITPAGRGDGGVMSTVGVRGRP